MSRSRLIKFLLLALAFLLSGCNLNPSSLQTRAVSLPLGRTSASFDDLSFDSKLGKVIVPAAESGTLALIDPVTGSSQLIPGFSKQTNPANQVIGTTSAVTVRGLIYALDSTALKINIVDPAAGKIIGSTPIQDAPDYIRYVSATSELWVTEKALGQIEIFSLKDGQPPVVTKTGAIQVPNGPEALLIDGTRGLAYTNQPKVGTTAVIQVMTHNIIAEWGNGCSKARGMAIDEDRGILFVVCNEGKLVMMDVNNNGLQITSQNYGGSLDFVAYNPRLKHVYLPSSASGVVAIFEVLETPSATLAPTDPTPTPAVAGDGGPAPTPGPKLSLVRLGTADTAVKAKCVTVDDHNNIWICDPLHAGLFLIQDTFPAGN